MYHKVALNESAGLTIAAEKLKVQFEYLQDQGYQTYHFSELATIQQLRHKKNVVITFDDGYVSQLELAYPLLQQYQLKATFFIPLKFVGKTDQWNVEQHPLMTWEQLSQLDPNVVELAFHSFAHQRYDTMGFSEIEADTDAALIEADKLRLPFTSCVAYPFGKFPKKDPLHSKFKQHWEAVGMFYGLRIGNRINRFPFPKPYEIQRLDIKGEYSLSHFRRKLKYGKIL